ncbi:MAG: hypothetical protein ACPLRA_00130 [Candidatus Saccharicenans sp.]
MRQIDFNFEVKLKSAYEALSQSVNLFKIYLDEKTPASGSEYYRAKSLLREGKLFFEEVLKEARKLLGPLPPYSTPEYAKWREETSKDIKLALGDKVDYETIKNLILSDSILPRLFSSVELENYLNKYYEDQKKGLRKLENLKCRIAIARLDDLIHEAEELFKQAQKKLQSSLV